MKTKVIKVLDEMTEVFYLVGKPEPSDREMLERTGWGDQAVTLLVKILGGGGCEACLSTFKGYVPYDLENNGTITVDGTSIRLATIVRDISYKDIPETLDVRKY